MRRLSISADRGSIDGDVARVHGYGAAHPELVRVEEPVYDVTWALFAVNPALVLGSLDALPATGWRATYLRGVGVCESALKRLLPADRLIDVTSDAQGFNMLRLGRSEVHCTADLSAFTLQNSPEFKGSSTITRRVVDIGSFPLHPYLHRKHAELAIRLATVLRQMKAEGLIDRYRTEVMREVERR
jgi:polar amino acid transport system substrate-binding protein